MAYKISNTESSSSNTEERKSHEFCERSRNDTALAALTRRFMELVKRSENGSLDLNVASLLLNAPKRRIYDIINVLEGICLLKKRSKNYIEWAGGQGNILRDAQLMTLIKEEEKLDQLIDRSRRQLRRVFKEHTQRFAYLTYEDVKNIPSLKEQTVIVIKAPAETKVEVPHPGKSLQVHLSSTQGPIDVFVCADDPMPEDCGCLANASTDGDNSIDPVPYSSTVQVSSTDDVSHNTGLSRDSILQPEPTQHSSPVSVTPFSPLLPTSEDQQSFVTLSPPQPFSLDGVGYFQSLVKDEGITDLFSAVDPDLAPLDLDMV
ncbi:transcription factor E2F3 [Sphaeramia orbicularis]|uniref:Transcription factor E2F3-like n=1 Tax=Sphaeramia orbicularis TaxID=375764 RepID=A0A673AA26_9TELE|nr:transcription factor E2F3-like [Sphaeramia orbicularis]